MRWVTRRRVAAAVALCGVGFAAGYGYAPELVPPAIRRPVSALNEALDPRVALLFAGAAAGVIGVLYAWVTQSDAGAAPMAERTSADPERSAAVAGDDLSAQYERRVEEGRVDDDEIRRRLRAVVVDAHRHAAGEEGAAAYVDRGAWTDDRYAAAFLSTTADVDYPWYHRLYAWLYPGRAYEHRVTRALRAAEAACAERVSGYDAPPPESESGLRALVEGSS